MKTTAARKTSSATNPETNHRRVIQLDESLYAIYKTGTIDILTPDGEQVDCIGRTTTQLNKFGSHEDVANNLRLIEELMLGNTEGLTLSPCAIAGLADVLSRAEGLLER